MHFITCKYSKKTRAHYSKSQSLHVIISFKGFVLPILVFRYFQVELDPHNPGSHFCPSLLACFTKTICHRLSKICLARPKPHCTCVFEPLPSFMLPPTHLKASKEYETPKCLTRFQTENLASGLNVALPQVSETLEHIDLKLSAVWFGINFINMQSNSLSF